MKVLFVCSGNICRSPMAEVIFSNLLKQDKIKTVACASAGIEAEPGQPMAQYSAIALTQCGEKLPKKPHASQVLTRGMVKKCDHIICMDKMHKWQIDMHDKLPNVYTLSNIDVPDPWGYGVYEYMDVCKHLQKAVKELYNKICKM